MQDLQLSRKILVRAANDSSVTKNQSAEIGRPLCGLSPMAA